jgi:hypothetical protein
MSFKGQLKPGIEETKEKLNKELKNSKLKLGKQT